MKSEFVQAYRSRLESLVQDGKINEELYRHFRKRDLQIISPKQYGLERLAEYFPEILIGASKEYIEKMTVPYQATSFLAARANSDGEAVYVFKIPGKPGGGVELLTGGERKPGDNAFASTHRILIGGKANMVSADNFMANKDQIWNFHFFADHFAKTDRRLYEDIVKLSEARKIQKSPYHIIVARSEDTFKRLGVVEEYRKNSIAALDPENETKVIFLTNTGGYDYASRGMPESDLVKYVDTGENFDMYQALRVLRKSHGVDVLLNDGGRQMSNGVRDAGLLGEERVTLEPYPGNQFISEIDASSVLGKEGSGIDGCELPGAVTLYSKRVADERANVYLYPLEETKIFS